MSTERFHLADSQGEDHAYLLTLHPGGDGALIAMRLAGMVAEPMIGLLVGVFSNGVASVAELMAQDVSALLDGIDANQIGPAVGKALASPEAQQLVRRDLMKHVVRDGHELANATNFDQAFQGNYLELFKLSWEVAKRNRFLPLGATS